jgi:hypothetical protein
VPAATAPVALTIVSDDTSGGTPLAPQDAPQLPAPTTVAGIAGCGGPGAGEGSPKGASAPTAAGVLASALEITDASNDASPSATAAGSPTLPANDPSTRPD